MLNKICSKNKNIFFSKYYFKNILKHFSVRDEAFWEEYSKRKSQGGKYPALESQEIIYNKVVHGWKYASNHSLTAKQLLECINGLKENEICPFVILDIREEIEFEIFKLPFKTEVKFIFLFF